MTGAPSATLKDGADKAKQAHLWVRHPDDWYVEPFECSRLLFANERFTGHIYDPACGIGRVVIEARSAGYEAYGTDLRNRWNGAIGTRDFLDRNETGYPPTSIVSNPPFKHCVGKTDFIFVRRCLEEATNKVALLLPADWHCGVAAHKFLRSSPLYKILCHTSRPSMPPGPVIEAGINPGGGMQRFAWFVFLIGFSGPVITDWLEGQVSTKKQKDDLNG